MSASSEEGQAISASVRALQAQQAALGQTTIATRALGSAWSFVKGFIIADVIMGGVSALKDFAKEAFNTAADLGELSEQLGITADAFQGLKLAASQSGVETENLQNALSKFSQKMGEASKGDKAMIESLQELGVKNLDLQGKLRPTEDLLQEVAQAIISIQDPAKRSAEAVDFFGKSGTKMLSLLTEMSRGTSALTRDAANANALISKETADTLDKEADRLKVNNQKYMAEMASLEAGAINLGHAFGDWLTDKGIGISEWLTRQFDGVNDVMFHFADDLSVMGAKTAAMFIAAFDTVPGALANVFSDAWNKVVRATAVGVNDLNAWLASHAPAWMGLTGGALVEVPADTQSGGANIQAAIDKIKAAGEAAAKAQEEVNNAARQTALKSAAEEKTTQLQTLDAKRRADEAAASALTKGAGTSAIANKNAGNAAEEAQKKYDKLIVSLTATAEAQDVMTKAAARGDVAFESTKIHLEAQQKAIEIYGKALDDTDPKLRKIEELLTRISQGKAAEAFSVATTELQKQNVILEAQISLMNEAPDIQAREIALIKSKQEAEKAGTAVTQDAIDARTKAIEQNETLKNQQGELQRAQELWTEPLKSALQSIQQTAADAFESMLTNGNFSFQSLAETFTKILKRMAAEFLALATVRPVMSVLVQAISGTGLISQNTASQLGFGGSTGGGLGSMLGGSTGGGGLFGGGGSSLFSGIGDWLSTPFTGPYAGLSPSSMQGVPMLSGAAGAGLTPLSLIGGLGSIGMGAYSLLSGNGSIGSMAGGIGGILGGGLSLASSAGLIGSAFGPVGMALGFLAPLLGGMLGGQTPPKITNQEYGQLSYGASGFGTSGGAWGPDANANNVTGTLGQIGTTMDTIFKAFGGVKDAGNVWGLALESFKESQGKDYSFANQTSFLVGPGGQKQQWGMGSNESDVGLTSAGVAATINSILGGAVGDISDNMRKALGSVNQSGKDTFDTLSSVVTEVMAFDDAIAALDKTTSEVENSLAQIDAQFTQLYATASKYDLPIDKIDEAKLKAKEKLYTDFLATFDKTTSGVQETLDAIDKSFQDFADHAAEVGKTIEQIAQDQLNVKTKLAEDFLAQQQQAILEITDPAQAQINALHAQRDQAMADAKAIQDAIGGTLDLLGVTAEHFKLLEDQLNATIAASKAPTETQATVAEIQTSMSLAAPAKDAAIQAVDDFVATMNTKLDQINGASQGTGAAAVQQLVAEKEAALAQAAQLDEAAKMGGQTPVMLELNGVVTASVAALRTWNAAILSSAKDFKTSMNNLFLEATDPLAAQIAQLHQQRDADIATAKAYNDALDTMLVEQNKHYQDVKAFADYSTNGTVDNQAFLGHALPISAGTQEYQAQYDKDLAAFAAAYAQQNPDTATTPTTLANYVAAGAQAGIQSPIFNADGTINQMFTQYSSGGQVSYPAGSSGNYIGSYNGGAYYNPLTGSWTMGDPKGAQSGGSTNPQFQTALAGLIDNASQGMSDMAQTVEDGYIDINQITEAYAKKEAQIKEAYYEQTLGSIEDVIKRLKYGDLSGLPQSVTLSGYKGQYEATLSAAQSGDSLAISKLAGNASDYLSQAHNYLGSSTAYFDLVKQTQLELEALVAQVKSGDTPDASLTNDTMATVAAIRETGTATAQQLVVLTQEVARISDLVEREVLGG